MHKARKMHFCSLGQVLSLAHQNLVNEEGLLGNFVIDCAQTFSDN